MDEKVKGIVNKESHLSKHVFFELMIPHVMSSEIKYLKLVIVQWDFLKDVFITKMTN